MEISKTEFAEVFGVKQSSIFVKHFYELLDEDKNGFISFFEMLNVFVSYKNGSEDDKLTFMFKIYNSGSLEPLESKKFKEILKSQIDCGDQEMIEENINKMFDYARLDPDEPITLNKFKLLMGYEVLSGALGMLLFLLIKNIFFYSLYPFIDNNEENQHQKKLLRRLTTIHYRNLTETVTYLSFIFLFLLLIIHLLLFFYFFLQERREQEAY